MAINFSSPSTGDNYSTAFVPNIQANQVGLAQWLDSANTTITGTPPTYAKRYNRTNSAVEEYSGSAWAPIVFHGLTYNSGNIGIGGTPSYKLHVTGTNYQVVATNGTNSNTLGASGGVAYVGSIDAVPLILQTGNAERARVDASGNFGVGNTPSGTYRLEVSGGISAASTTSPTRIVLQNSFSNTGNRNWALLASQNNYGDFVIRTSTAQNGDPVAAGVDRFNIDTAGNVGIGTAPGSAKLDVAGTVHSSLQFDNGGQQGATTGLVLGGLGSNYGRALEASNDLWQLGYSATRAGAVTGVLNWNSSGNVGIGNSPSTARLLVLGGALPGSSNNGLNFASALAAGRLISGDTNSQTAVINTYLDSSIIEVSAGTSAGYASGVVVASRSAAVDPGTLKLLTYGAERVRVDSSGQAGFGLAPVSSGNNRALLQLLGSANGGIYLGNTANAASNVLDWYEEGSFSPTAVGATTAGSTTYTVQIGRFVRFGRLVLIYIQIGWGTHSGTGNLRVAGFPYAPVYGALRAVPGATGQAFDAWSSVINVGQTYVTLNGNNQNTGTNAARNIANNDSWEITGFIEV